MSDRRHTDKPDLNPAGVMSLDINHAAMRENRTLFPSTVVTVTADEPDRLLVSGKNNRKIGSTVEKGKFKGYGIYCLSLEERATCPEDCSARGICYGNGMQMARRHRIGDPDVFFDRLGFEIADLLDSQPGLLIRLHVLGDFPSVEYVSFWKDVLDEHPNVACFGYTHRNATAWGGDEIGDAIQAVKDAHPERFRIRWSTDVARPDSAIILDHVPRGSRGPNQEIVCPSQTDATACCATCSLCWEAPHENIGFIKHGRSSDEAQASIEMKKLAVIPEAKPVAIRNVEKADREDLEERVRQIESALVDNSWVPTDWKLTASEVALLNALSLRKLASKEALHTLMYGNDPDGGPDIKIIDVMICKTRPKIEPWGVYIDTVWGQGYQIRPASVKIIEALKAGEPLPPMLTETALAGSSTRPIQPIALPAKLMPSVLVEDRPDVRMVRPTDLRVEPSYQRDLSGKSIALIKRIITDWDWAKFKPPVCAETPDGLFVIDGQHTAIAAASHPKLVTIPVMVVKRDIEADRADAFVSQNTARIAMSPLQIFHAELVAGKKGMSDVLKSAIRAGGTIPKFVPAKGKSEPGQITAISAVQRVLSANGVEKLDRILRIAVLSGIHPVNSTLVYCLQYIVASDAFPSVASETDEVIANAIAALERTVGFDRAAQACAVEAGMNRYRAAARLIEGWIVESHAKAA